MKNRILIASSLILALTSCQDRGKAKTDYKVGQTMELMGSVDEKEFKNWLTENGHDNSLADKASNVFNIGKAPHLKLEYVLEQQAAEGWELVSIGDGAIIFKR